MTSYTDAGLELAARAQALLGRAQWAAWAFARYDKGSVDRLLSAATQAAETNARGYAEWAIRETGCGVSGDTFLVNLMCSRGLLESYQGHDFVTPRVDQDSRIVSIPRPAGVVLVSTPVTAAVASVYSATLLALLTRNAVIIAPHPLARECTTHAAQTLAEAAVSSGAPDGIVQVVGEPSDQITDALMADARTSLVLAAGGRVLMRAAHPSGQRALLAGAANVPVLVDASADLAAAASQIVDSKCFDHSTLPTCESVLIVEESCRDQLITNLTDARALLLSPDERDRVREVLFRNGDFAVGFLGRSARTICEAAGVPTSSDPRVLIAPIDLAVPEEPLAHQKLCPVLGLATVPSARRGIDAACAVARLGEAGHSAAIHSTDSELIMAYGARLPVHRVLVGVGSSLGRSGLDANLALGISIAAGPLGRARGGANLAAGNLVDWTRIVYSADTGADRADIAAHDPWQASTSPVPPYPQPSNIRQL